MSQAAFTRKKLMRHPEALVESVCALCGLSVLAGTPDSLDRMEAEHRSQCRPRQGERRQAVLRTGERRIAILGDAQSGTRQGTDQRKKDRRTGTDRRSRKISTKSFPAGTA